MKLLLFAIYSGVTTFFTELDLKRFKTSTYTKWYFITQTDFLRVLFPLTSPKRLPHSLLIKTKNVNVLKLKPHKQ